MHFLLSTKKKYNTIMQFSRTHTDCVAITGVIIKSKSYYRNSEKESIELYHRYSNVSKEFYVQNVYLLLDAIKKNI